MKQRRKMIGRGFVSDEKYLKLGKYKANKEKLLGGKLQIRSENKNQVNNVKKSNDNKKYKRYSFKNKLKRNYKL